MLSEHGVLTQALGATEIVDHTLEVWQDLPRMIHPRTGVDDTQKICERIRQQLPPTKVVPDQSANWRKLYMSIYNLRYNSKKGWCTDVQVQKLDAPL